MTPEEWNGYQRALESATAEAAKYAAQAAKWRKVAHTVHREKRKIKAALDNALREW